MDIASKKILIAAADTGLLSVLLIGLLAGCIVVADHTMLFAASYLILVVIAMYSGHNIFKKKFEWYEPINFFFLSMGIGFGLRGMYIAWGYYEYPVGIDQQEVLFYHLNQAAWYGLAATLLFLSGYSFSDYARRISLHLPFFRPKTRFTILYIWVAIYTLIGIGGLLFLIKESGFSLSTLSLANIAIKRLYMETSHYSNATAQFLTIATLMMTVVHFRYRKTKIFWPLFVLSCVWPIYSSIRADLFSIWIMVMIAYSLFAKRISNKVILLVCIIVVLSSSTLLILRSFNDRSGNDKSRTEITMAVAVEDLLGGATLGDITAFAHIIWGVSHNYELQYGKTYLTLLTRPIPRGFWPEKPVNLGNWVAIDFYERPYTFNARGVIQVGGIPPPMVAELYWNFHFAGIIGGMFIFGFLCRVLYEYLMVNRTNVYTIIIYAWMSVFILKYTMIDFSNISTSFLLQMVLLFLPIYLISGGLMIRRKKHPIMATKTL